MKLARITKPLRSVQVRVVLTGDLNASVERYARYYEHVHGDSVDTRALIPGILRASSRPIVNSICGPAPRTGTNRAGSRLRPQPTAAPRHRNDLHRRGTG